MAELSPHPDSNGDTGDDAGAGPGRGSTTGTPGWVKVFGIVALVLVLLLVIMLLSGGHGPGRHTPSGESAGHTPLFSVVEHGAQQP